MIYLVNKPIIEFKAHLKDFLIQKQKDDCEPLYENLKKFDEYDTEYYAMHDSMMERIETYARQHPEEFVKFV